MSCHGRGGYVSSLLGTGSRDHRPQRVVTVVAIEDTLRDGAISDDAARSGAR